MHTLFDLISKMDRLQESAGSGAMLSLGYKPKSRIIVPGERDLLLPSDPKGLTVIQESVYPVAGIANEYSKAARSAMLSRPGMVFPLHEPTDEELEALGASPRKFRSENPRQLGLGVAVSLPTGEAVYGVSRVVFLENGIRMGSTAVLSADDRWTSDLIEAEEWTLEVLCESKQSVLPEPEKRSSPWRRVVILLGGARDAARFPADWKRQLLFAAGLRRVRLDIRPSPEASRSRIVHELKTEPPDGLLVWADFVAHPEAFLAPYSSARPNGLAECLGSASQTMTFEDHKSELLMHVRELAPVLDIAVEDDQVVTWRDAAEAIKKLEGAHFRLSDRAISMLESNPYPRPGRMKNYVEKLAAVALAYREGDSQLSAGLKEYAIAYQGIEIALFDGTLSPPEIRISGVTVMNSSGECLTAVPHVKVDDYKSPEQCGRIYFAIDKEDKRFIIDHVGIHNY